MRSVNIHEAKTHLSRLVEEVSSGESITIARAGKPVALLVPLRDSPLRTKSLIGFLDGRVTIADDFNRMAEDEIAAMFEDDD